MDPSTLHRPKTTPKCRGINWAIRRGGLRKRGSHLWQANPKARCPCSASTAPLAAKGGAACHQSLTPPWAFSLPWPWWGRRDTRRVQSPSSAYTQGSPAVEGCRKRRAGRSALGSGFPDGHSFSSGHLLAQLWGGESVLVKAASFGFW